MARSGSQIASELRTLYEKDEGLLGDLIQPKLIEIENFIEKSTKPLVIRWLGNNI